MGSLCSNAWTSCFASAVRVSQGGRSKSSSEYSVALFVSCMIIQTKGLHERAQISEQQNGHGIFFSSRWSARASMRLCSGHHVWIDFPRGLLHGYKVLGCRCLLQPRPTLIFLKDLSNQTAAAGELCGRSPRKLGRQVIVALQDRASCEQPPQEEAQRSSTSAQLVR